MLVNYSSSSSSESEPSPKKIKKLPVPFERKPLSRAEIKQDDGRKRQIEHVEGNWASHIFIQVETELIEKFKSFIEEIETKFIDVKAIKSPHISLSKMFILKFHWIDNFLKILKNNVKFNEFHLEFAPEVKFLFNEDKSRYFASLVVHESCREQLEKIVKLIDGTLKEFEFPPYYSEAIYHMSIFWKLTEFSDEEKENITLGIETLRKDVNFYNFVDKITFKTGNKINFLHSFS